MRKIWTVMAAAFLAVALAAGWLVTGPLAPSAAERYAADALADASMQRRIHDEVMVRVDEALLDLSRSDAVRTTTDVVSGALAACTDILGLFGEAWADELGEQCRSLGGQTQRGIEEVAAAARAVFDEATWNLVRSPDVRAQLIEQVDRLHGQMLDGASLDVSLGALRTGVDQLLGAADADPLLREVVDTVLAFPGLDRPLTVEVGDAGEVPPLWRAGDIARPVAIVAALLAIGALVAVALTATSARRRHLGAALGGGVTLAVVTVAAMAAWLLVGLPDIPALVGQAAVLSTIWRTIAVAAVLAIAAGALLWSGRARPQAGVVVSTWPAGWYADGQGGRLRWWDGVRWTEHQHEARA